MVDWRTLGEVPDSEDEDDFDSPSTEESPATDLAEQPTFEDLKATPIPPTEEDIWDVPSSPGIYHAARSPKVVRSDLVRPWPHRTELPTEENRNDVDLQEKTSDVHTRNTGSLRGQHDDSSGQSVEALPKLDSPGLRGQNNDRRIEPGDLKSRVVWDIPSSAEAEAGRISAPKPLSERSSPSHHHTRVAASSPLSSPQLSSQDLPPIEQLVGGASNYEEQAQRPSPGNVGTAALKKIVYDLPPSPSRSPAAVTPGPPRDRSEAAPTPMYSQILGHDTEQEEARLIAARYERSLRARKPEQMRPYAMEMARFNRDWTKSGMRPIRFAYADDGRSRQKRAASEEADFEPESQGSNNRLEDGQTAQSGSTMEGLMVTGPSSSPMQTSPLDNRGGPSSLVSSQAETEHTSLDDEELPTVLQLAKPRQSHSSKKDKPRRQQLASRPNAAKRRRIVNPLDSSPLRQDTQQVTVRQDSPDPLGLPESPAASPTLTPDSPVRDVTAAMERATALDTADPFASDSDVEETGSKALPAHNTSDEDPGSSSDSQGSRSNAVDKNRSRIRGVLPASWLRIDQQTGRAKIQKKIQRPLNRSADWENRRGVAHRRQADGNVVHDKFLFSESEDEAPPIESRPTTDAIFHNQTRLALQPMVNPPAIEIASSDDGSSAMEEDHIDHMVSGRKRQMKLTEAFGKTAKRSKTDTRPAASMTKRNNQAKTSSARSKLRSTTHDTQRAPRIRSCKPKLGPGSRIEGLARTRRHPAHHLSILDVIKHDAPQFLKVAARTAKSRPDHGRASPTRKRIQLATRQDHLDAANVLGDWRRGSIKPRESVTAARRSSRSQPGLQPQARPPQKAQTTSSTQSWPLLTVAPRKLTKHLSNGGHVRYKEQDSGTRKAPQIPAFQPAEIQTEGTHADTAGFQVGKKLLDRLYRKRRGAPTVASTITEIDRSNGASHPSVRRRKQLRPQQIDLEEPQYSHVHDPVASPRPPSPEPGEVAQNSEGPKLLGLGPYGTTYTHHFEVFHLKSGIYFHNSTVIGSGMLETVLHTDYSRKPQDSRPRAALVFDRQTLRWGPWDAQVSSEIGVVFDYVSDKIDKPAAPDDLATPSSVRAADHLLAYIMDSITFDSDTDVSSFLARTVEILPGFVDGLPEDPSRNLAELLQVCDRVSLFVFVALRMSCVDATLLSYQIQLEGVLKRLTVSTARLLTKTLSNELRETYQKLNNVRARERGLRNDDLAAHSWTLMLRILHNASIPKAGFWEVVQEVLLPPDLTTSTRVGPHERAWEGLFTLLPLTDFTDSGVIVRKPRLHVASDGWSLPQRLLKRVYQLYQDNSRQSPAFNNYCRALVARCHCLVQDWGWRKSSGIVGVMFDFFGSQNLEHLRNEEIYSSPRFLENLHQVPSLEVKPEDPCFHIFLKLLALSIQKLKEDGSTKDIRNLVARTLPNHSRQYSKEQNIHERDLAALRNHHDLLVTLYWAAPLDLRPNVDILERLVAPTSSHKEACLINLRAWNQLARFVISTGVNSETSEIKESFGPFRRWRDTLFRHMVQQLDTVASDIQQQLVNMPADVSKSVSPEMIDAMVRMNKASILDIIHASMAASLDVMKHSPDLDSAQFALSTAQLHRVFSSFTVSPPEMSWGILRTALATLDSFLSRLDVFQEARESQQSESQIFNQALGGGALDLLDETVASGYFKMARWVLASAAVKDTNAWGAMDRFQCTEQAIQLGARLTVKFINAGFMALPDLFKTGKYRLFEESLHKLGLEQRKFSTLFVATLLKHDFDDFRNVGFTLQELYMLSIVKPQESLAYEYKLAEQLIFHGKAFVPKTVVGLATSPDYGINRQLFEFAIDHMRVSVRDVAQPLEKDIKATHKRTLGLVMAQMQNDLKTIADDKSQHPAYVRFVQSIISLIMTHGDQISHVDMFFLQHTKEYAPPREDPQHQVGKMASYGLRVLEGNERAESQLFWFLHGCFKSMLVDGKLHKEAQLLARGLRKPGVLSFVLGKMMPAIIHAMLDTPASVLLDVYLHAMSLFLDSEDESIVLGENDLPPIQTTLASILNAVERISLWETRLTGRKLEEDLHLLCQLVRLMNLLWPSIYMLIVTPRPSLPPARLSSLLGWVRQFTAGAEIYLEDWPKRDERAVGSADETTDPPTNQPLINKSDLFGGVTLEVTAESPNQLVVEMADNLIKDMSDTWLIDDCRITIKSAGRVTQSTPAAPTGIERPEYQVEDLVADLHCRVAEWNSWWNKAFGMPNSMSQLYCEALLF